MNSISELVAQLGSDDQAKAYQARLELMKRTSEATKRGNDKDQAALATALAESLNAKDSDKANRPKYSTTARREVCQFLSQVGGDSEVPALVEAIKDLQVREMARWALERIPGPAATAALVKAMDEVGPEFRVGVVSSLATRQGEAVVGTLHKAASDDDPQVRLAAVEALANFPEQSNDEPIVAATKKGSARHRARAQRARVRLAEKLRVAGNKNAAVSIYKAIIANDAAEPQKKAAKIALEQLT